jgi:hypothetical protein
MTALADIAPTVAKLVRLLGTDKPGEVIACVNVLRRVLSSAELDLHDLASVIELAARRGALHGDGEVLTIIRCCYKHEDHLTTKELELIRSMADRYPPPAQMKLLRSIYERCLQRDRERASAPRGHGERAS